MEGITWFIIGLLTGIFKKEVLEALKLSVIWLTTPNKKEEKK